MQPLVSVIIPTFNDNKFLTEAITSALGQTYDHREIIVINDGSTDDTSSVLDSYGDKITVINQENNGAGAARNKGIDSANGPYIAFLDGDDVWEEDKLAKQVEYLEREPEIGLVWTDWLCMYPDNNGNFSIFKKPVDSRYGKNVSNKTTGWLYNQLLFDTLVWTSTVLVRRSVIDKVGKFDETLLRGQDYDYWLRTSRICKMHKINEALAFYRVNEVRRTTPRRVNYEYMILNRITDKWGFADPEGNGINRKAFQKRMHRSCFEFAYSHFCNGDMRIARNYFLKCLGHKPLSGKGLIYALISSLRSLFQNEHIRVNE